MAHRNDHATHAHQSARQQLSSGHSLERAATVVYRPTPERQDSLERADTVVLGQAAAQRQNSVASSGGFGLLLNHQLQHNYRPPPPAHTLSNAETEMDEDVKPEEGVMRSAPLQPASEADLQFYRRQIPAAAAVIKGFAKRDALLAAEKKRLMERLRTIDTLQALYTAECTRTKEEVALMHYRLGFTVWYE